jgi:hypothetical protein
LLDNVILAKVNLRVVHHSFYKPSTSPTLFTEKSPAATVSTKLR